MKLLSSNLRLLRFKQYHRKRGSQVCQGFCFYSGFCPLREGINFCYLWLNLCWLSFLLIKSFFFLSAKCHDCSYWQGLHRIGMLTYHRKQNSTLYHLMSFFSFSFLNDCIYVNKDNTENNWEKKKIGDKTVTRWLTELRTDRDRGVMMVLFSHKQSCSTHLLKTRHGVTCLCIELVEVLG
jgi:hypothetical protein